MARLVLKIFALALLAICGNCSEEMSLDEPFISTVFAGCSTRFPLNAVYGPGKPKLSAEGSCISCSAFNSSEPRWHNTYSCTACPKNTPVYRSTDNTCIANPCAQLEVWHATMNRCIPCPTKEPGCAAVGEQLACETWNGEYCMEPTPSSGNCPTTFPTKGGPGRPYNNGGRCEACAADTPRWHPNLHRCVACGKGVPLYNSFDNTCNSIATCPPPSLWQTTINECIPACPQALPNCCASCSPSQIPCARWTGVECE